MGPLILTLLAMTANADTPAYEPTENYTIREIEQFKVYINSRLLNDEDLSDIRDQTLRPLEVKLYDINRVVPEAALVDLRTIPIWVEAESESFPCMCYHVSADWLRENGHNPEKAGAVELSNPATFIDWTFEQPYMVLHELAHGYHHQFLKYDNESVREGYRLAKESGTYDAIQNWAGATARHYAMNNDTEYFSELTEAYFGTNDFYPFVRAELKEHDPWMYERMSELWRGKAKEVADRE